MLKNLCVFIFVILKTHSSCMHARARAYVRACMYVGRTWCACVWAGLCVLKAKCTSFFFCVFVTAFRESFTNQFYEMIKIQMSTCIVIFFVKNLCNNRSNFVLLLYTACSITLVLSTFYSA